MQVDIISINVPEDVDPNEVKITSLSYEGYGDIHSKREDGFMKKESKRSFKDPIERVHFL